MRLHRLYPVDTVVVWVYLGWALVLALPGQTFIGPTFTVFARVASEVTWAAVFAALGLVRLAAALSGSPHWRLVGDLSSIAGLGFAGLIFFQGNPLSLGAQTCIAIVAGSVYAYWGRGAKWP